MTITTELALIFTEFLNELQIFADSVPALLIFCVAVAIIGMVITWAALIVATWLGVNK